MIDEDRLSEAYERALSLEKAGDAASAVLAYRECLSIDPEDHTGAALRIAALGEGEAPASAGHAYVATLFDQHADDFEDILVRQLQYGVPGFLAERLSALGHTRFDRCLDLGCGTGLVGEALDGRADTLIGVDLSEAMIETAFDKQVYDDLYIGEAVEFLAEFEETELFDLVVAADVMPYIGDLDPILSGVAARCAPAALFAFSTETLTAEEFAGRDYKVGRHHRFHHGERYLRERLETHGFTCLDMVPITVRLQEGQPAPGHLVVAQRTGGVAAS